MSFTRSEIEIVDPESAPTVTTDVAGAAAVVVVGALVLRGATVVDNTTVVDEVLVDVLLLLVAAGSVATVAAGKVVEGLSAVVVGSALSSVVEVDPDDRSEVGAAVELVVLVRSATVEVVVSTVLGGARVSPPGPVPVRSASFVRAHADASNTRLKTAMSAVRTGPRQASDTIAWRVREPTRQVRSRLVIRELSSVRGELVPHTGLCLLGQGDE